MLSLIDISVIKVAIEICNNPELKRKILFAFDDVNKKSNLYDGKQQWNEIVEKKAMVTLRNVGLPEKLQEKVMGIILPIGMRMLTWAEYHEGTLGFSHQIPDLYRQITKEDKEKYYSTRQPVLVRFWSCYLMGEVDKRRRDKTLDQYRLEKAVQNGSKAAVEYCLERTIRKNDVIVDAAVEAVSNMIVTDNWIVFRDRRYDAGKERWVPSDYYVDIVSFLLLKMREGQQIEFLKKDIEGVKYVRDYFEDQRRSRVLEYFLNWPYQNYFMETAGLMWEFLPERNYAVLLLKICDKIEPGKEGNLKYGEEKSYDYRGLLKEFWYQSPVCYKRYVLSNQEVDYRTDRKFGSVTIKTGVGILIKLLNLKNFTHEDRKIIKLILSSATDDKEKENILSSEEWRGICIGLMKEEREILDRFVQNCFSSKEKADKFKRELIFMEEALHICIDFVKNDEWNAAESFIKWSALSEEEIKQLKREMIYSEDGKLAYLNLVLYEEGVEVANKIFKGCFSSSEEVREFKKELIFSDIGLYEYALLVRVDTLEFVDKFINWYLSSQEEIKEFKKEMAYRAGDCICEYLISDYSGEDINDEQGYTIGSTTKFEGGKWEEIEKFLTWCFSSEGEISDFKKNALLEMSGVEIHFNLIKSNQWEEAETFFAWLGLSAEEIKKLKKDTLFNYYEADKMFMELMHSREGDQLLIDYGSKQEAIELLLRWYLTDKETILEFNDHFKQKYNTQYDRDDLKIFDLMIEQRLRDLDEEKKGVKRKSEIFSPSKKFCN